MSNLLVGGSASLFLIIIGVFIFLQFVPVGLWISAISAGVSISIFNLVGMRLRRVPPDKIVLPLIKANKAGLIPISWKPIIWPAATWTGLSMP